MVLYDAGQHHEALAVLEKLELLHEEVRGLSHRDTAGILTDVAYASYTARQRERAIDYARRAIQIIRDTRGPASFQYVRCLMLVAQLDDDAGRTEQARAEFDELAKVTRRVYPDGHPERARCLQATAGHYQLHGQHTVAAGILEEVLASQHRALVDRFSAQAFRCVQPSRSSTHRRSA